MIRKSIKLFLISVVGLALITVFSFNASASSATSIGLGDDFVTITGPDAVYSNPGAVNASDNVFALEVGYAASFWNNLLTNDFIEEDDKDDMLAKIEENGLLLGTDSRTGAKLMIGPVTLFGDLKADGIVNLNRDVAELLLKGNEPDGTYSFDGSNGFGAVYADGGINLSIRAPQGLIEEWGMQDVYVGFSYHSLMGSIFKAEGNGELSFDWDDTVSTNSADFTVLYSDVDNEDFATGSAFDLGAYVDISDRYSAGFSIMNIGSMTSKDVMKLEMVYDEETEEFEEEEEFKSNEDLTWNLPFTVRGGARMDYNRFFDFMGDYSYTKYQLIDTKDVDDHKFAIATEITPISILPLRTGLSYSTLRDDLKWSAGMGVHLGPLKVDVGFSDLNQLFYNAKGGEMAALLKLEF